MRTGLISKYSTHLIKIASEVAVGKKDKIIINGDDYDTLDGTAVRDYIHVSDLADIHLICGKHLIANGQSDILIVDMVLDIQLNRLLKTVIKHLKNTEIGIRRPGDIKSVVANANKFYQKFL